jgi:hypothetical protein
MTPFGVIAEFVPKRTLSSIEERGVGITQRPKPILERFGRSDIVAIKTDVFPAEWSDVGQQRVGQNFLGREARRTARLRKTVFQR